MKERGRNDLCLVAGILTLAVAIVFSILVLVHTISPSDDLHAVDPSVGVGGEFARVDTLPEVEVVGFESHPEATLMRAGGISGVVYSRDGVLAVGARVELVRVANESVGTIGTILTAVEADNEGRFFFGELPFGRYGVRASLGEEVAEEKSVLMRSMPFTDIILQLHVASSISGLVLDLDRTPVAGAMLYPLICDGEPAYIDDLRGHAVESNRDGRFEFTYITPGDWGIYAEAKGFGPALSDVVPSGTSDLEILLVPALGVSGRVVKGGRPVEGCLVQIVSDDLPAPEQRVASNADGSFFFNSIGPGNYLLEAVKDCDIAQDAPLRLTLQTTPLEDLEIELVSGGVVRGRVYMQETGEGIPNVEVRASPLGERRNRRTSEPSDPDGSYEISGLSAGTYELWPGWVSGFASLGMTRNFPKFDVEPGAVREGVDITLRRGITVSGRVLDDEGTPVAGADVRGTREGWQDQHKSGADGAYILANLAPGGPIRIKAEHTQATSSVYGPMEVLAEGLTGVDLELSVPRTGLIAGVVIDLRGRPVLGRVAAMTNENDYFAVPNHTMTDADGQFMMPNVPAGAYDLCVQVGDGEQQCLMSLTLKTGQQVRDLRLVFEREEVLEISGLVQDQEGNPVSHSVVELALERRPQNYLMLSAARSGLNGEFRLTGLSPGNYRLEATAHGYTNGIAESVQAGESNVLVTMQGSPRLSGVVVDTEGKPVTAFEVASVYRGDEVGASNSLRARWERFANLSGAFEIVMPVGAFDVVARAKGYSTGRTQTGALDAGESRDGLVIVLQKSEAIRGRVLNAREVGVEGALIFSGALPEYPMESAAYAVTTSVDDGRFEVPAGEPGRALHFSAIHATEGMGEVRTLEAGEPLEISLQAEASLVIEVTQGGKAAPGALVALVALAGSDSNLAVADDQGRVLRRNLPPGEVAVSASSADRGAASDEQIVVLESGMETQVELELVEVEEEPESPADGDFEKRAARN